MSGNTCDKRFSLLISEDLHKEICNKIVKQNPALSGNYTIGNTNSKDYHPRGWASDTPGFILNDRIPNKLCFRWVGFYPDTVCKPLSDSEKTSALQFLDDYMKEVGLHQGTDAFME